MKQDDLEAAEAREKEAAEKDRLEKEEAARKEDVHSAISCPLKCPIVDCIVKTACTSRPHTCVLNPISTHLQWLKSCCSTRT